MNIGTKKENKKVNEKLRKRKYKENLIKMGKNGQLRC